MRNTSYYESRSNEKGSFLKRKTIVKGIIDLKAFDEFVQKALDKYSFIEPWDELYESADTYSKLIISNKSAIPDLVIFNKRFNKNYCFFENKKSAFNPFPRCKFLLNAKSPYSNSYNSSYNNSQAYVKDKEKEIEVYSNIEERNRKFSERDYKEEEFNEEEDPEWLEIDIKEIERNKINFQALPEKSEFDKEKDTNREINNDINNFNFEEENMNLQIKTNTEKKKKNLVELNKSDDIESNDGEDALNRLVKIYDKNFNGNSNNNNNIFNNQNFCSIKIEKINLFVNENENDNEYNSLEIKEEENILFNQQNKFFSSMMKMDVNNIFNNLENNQNNINFNNNDNENDNRNYIPINAIFADNLFNTEKNDSNFERKDKDNEGILNNKYDNNIKNLTEENLNSKFFQNIFTNENNHNIDNDNEKDKDKYNENKDICKEINNIDINNDFLYSNSNEKIHLLKSLNFSNDNDSFSENQENKEKDSIYNINNEKCKNKEKNEENLNAENKNSDSIKNIFDKFAEQLKLRGISPENFTNNLINNPEFGNMIFNNMKIPNSNTNANINPNITSNINPNFNLNGNNPFINPSHFPNQNFLTGGNFLQNKNINMMNMNMPIFNQPNFMPLIPNHNIPNLIPATNVIPYPYLNRDLMMKNIAQQQNLMKQNLKQNEKIEKDKNIANQHFLENPSTVIQKNLSKRGWSLMGDDNKPFKFLDSQDLLLFLKEENKTGKIKKLNWICDYESDMFFKPEDLLEELNEHVPKLLENLKQKNAQQQNIIQPPIIPYGIPIINNPNMQINFNLGMKDPRIMNMGIIPPNGNININNNLRANPTGFTFNNMTPTAPQPFNMNINLQFVNNDIKLNNILFGQNSNNNNIPNIGKNEAENLNNIKGKETNNSKNKKENNSINNTISNNSEYNNNYNHNGNNNPKIKQGKNNTYTNKPNQGNKNHQIAQSDYNKNSNHNYYPNYNIIQPINNTFHLTNIRQITNNPNEDGINNNNKHINFNSDSPKNEEIEILNNSNNNNPKLMEISKNKNNELNNSSNNFANKKIEGNKINPNESKITEVYDAVNKGMKSHNKTKGKFVNITNIKEVNNQYPKNKKATRK